ncbi:toxin [Streptomyces luteireticuli]|uniref:toxin n=1 Tax=Streptomyces luteireticuli TaxID=173858 RepID=UPI003558D4FC
MRWLLSGSEMRRLSKHCFEQLEDLPLPEEFTLPGLIAGIEQARDCTIHLVPVPTHTDLRSACGLRLSVGRTHFILYRPRPTPNQTLNIIFHELSHLWFNHGNDVDLAGGLPAHLQPLFAGLLDPHAPAVVNARAHYESADEKEAELFASFIQCRIREQTARGQDPLSRMEASLTHPMARPPRSGQL